MKRDMEQFLKQFMAVLLMLRADCSLFVLFTTTLSPLIQTPSV
jgi:hypothetical protein